MVTVPIHVTGDRKGVTWDPLIVLGVFSGEGVSYVSWWWVKPNPRDKSSTGWLHRSSYFVL